MIPIKIEATNPSNIGAYKNTPCTQPTEPRKHDKPVRGSYKDWIETKLTEGKRVILEDTNLSKEDLIAAAVSAILQNPRYQYITYWLDNEVDDGATLAANEKELLTFVEYTLFPIAEEQYAEGKIEVTPEALCKLWDKELTQLNRALSSQYGKGVRI